MENKITDIFGINVFNEDLMRKRLPSDVFSSLKKTIDEGAPLEADVAKVVASAMKDWAIEKGATHYTHWFQPMTGITAEKHDSFIATDITGNVTMDFSGKELIKGEPDASSFPSGGLRATFEARGYTSWDPTAYAFVKDQSLYIPTAFCSYSGEALDKRTPLLRSMQVINMQAVRVLRLMGKDVKKVTPTVGPEQEYFLIDRALYLKRKDLIVTGRTLFGAKPPKGQEMDDHYFGSLKERVSKFMHELDQELWKLGVLAKTKHNEVAPAQHELAPIYVTASIAVDNNQLTMELMKKIASHHGLVCLLHEKPFAGVNGSGKHNNWSLSTDAGENLLKPGKQPQDNKQFLLFLAAVIKAVDEHGDLLRYSISNAGNDHRLGGNEAPPAIVSMYLGDQLSSIFEAIAQERKIECMNRLSIHTGVQSLPEFKKDTTDRNRTSPMAFTGNKFEFRMPGSSDSIADPNVVMNTIVAEQLKQFADRMEKSEDVEAEINAIIKDVAQCNFQRIVFNGNNYSEEWVAEAGRRGLPNIKSTVDAAKVLTDPKNIKLFADFDVLSESEVGARHEIMLENYAKIINIEALTMLEMAKREIVPAVILYSKQIFEILGIKKASGLELNLEKEENLARKINNLTASLMDKIEQLENCLIVVKEIEGICRIAEYYRDGVFVAMQNLRAVVDELETIMPSSYWPFPTYSELLFNV